MRVLRSALQFALFWMWTAGWICLAFVIAPFRRRAVPELARRCWAPGVLRIAGCRLEPATGTALDFTRPCVYVLNHQSALDIPVAMACIPTDLRFVAKHSLRYVPFIGAYMALAGMVFIDRSRRAQALRSLAAAVDRIHAGASIGGFPEGTRSRTGELLPFKKGLFHLAISAGVPVVPVAIDGSERVLPGGGLVFQPGSCRIRFGAPIETTGLSADDTAALAARAQDAVRELREAMRRDAGAHVAAPT